MKSGQLHTFIYANSNLDSLNIEQKICLKAGVAGGIIPSAALTRAGSIRAAPRCSDRFSALCNNPFCMSGMANKNQARRHFRGIQLKILDVKI